MGLRRVSLSGSTWNSSWIQTNQLEVPSNPKTLLTSSMDTKSSGSNAHLLMFFRVIEHLMSLKKFADKIRMFQTLLKNQKFGYLYET
jgi:hypothetical protein